MIWRKEFSSNHLKNYDYLITLIIILIVIGLFYRQPFFYALIGIFSTYLLLSKLYDRTFGEKLTLTNKRTTLRLFQGEEDTLTFTLQNHSSIPIVNGQFEFRSDKVIRVLENSVATDKQWNEQKISVSMMGKEETIVAVAIKAEQRGVARIDNITYAFPHLLNFSMVTLLYSPYYLTEIIVFPKPIKVQDVEIAFQMTPGSQRFNSSPFEDVQSHLGIREYNYNDPFHRINWKASVKSQSLQTNEYEKVIDMSFVVIVNLGVKHGLNIAQFSEDLISHTAYVCQYATEKGAPFEVYINARKPGNIPYVSMSAGQGKTHYGQLLEMLARINKQSMVVPFHQMIHRVGQQLLTRKTIVILGEITAESSQVINQWKQRQHRVFQIKAVEDVAIMKQWGIRNEK